MTSTTVASDAPVTTARVEWATVPRVNLLPSEIIEGRSFRRLQRVLAGVVAGVVVLGAAGFLFARHEVSTAQAELDQAAARTTQLQQQQAQFAEVPKVLAQLDAAAADREKAMATDVLWYRFLDELAVATPSNVWLGGVSLNIAAGSADSTAQDALTTSGVGSVTVTGTATKYPAVADWLTKVTSVHGMSLSRLQSAALNEGNDSVNKISFSASVNVTTDAFSHRYDRKAD